MMLQSSPYQCKVYQSVRMSRLQKEKCKLSVQVSQLEEELTAARERDGVCLVNLSSHK